MTAPYHCATRKSDTGRWRTTVLNAQGHGGVKEYDTWAEAIADRDALLEQIARPGADVRGPACDVGREAMRGGVGL